MTELSMKKELEALKIENQLLKELLSQFPQAIDHSSIHFSHQTEKMMENQLHHNNGRKMDFSITSDMFEVAESILYEILDHVPHHIVFTDKNGIISLCNLQAARDLKVEQRDVIGKHIRELLKLPDEKIIILETARTGTEVVNKEVLDRNYGIINTRIIYDADGSIKRVIGTFQFLNRFKDAEKQALAGRIAAGIAHEIRNPLTTVRGYLQFLQGSVDNEISDLFESLLIPEIDRANKIISDFLRIAKPTKTKKEFFQVEKFFNDHLANFLNSEALLYNGSINYDISPDSASRFLEGDSDELIQVFINLFRNSLEANQDQRLSIQINVKLVENWLRISFRDNGKGINPSILPYIFDPFFTTKDEGTGLGLSVSRKIIENHHGIMEVDSSKEGTIFTILLPVEK
ncbi:ATP-binding protein [Jeotgalibacillus soli]|uniref:histidine kinase n=1 Tax=Jeotgalibacillus soli TaxID=889306 RepID=A0A0C2RA92_9BACL|nr:ATP-binding protein [Jeotgalibacillus soli]KIL47235.1 ATPase [Jeotgalibacillus soli]